MTLILLKKKVMYTVYFFNAPDKGRREYTCSRSYINSATQENTHKVFLSDGVLSWACYKVWASVG